MDAPTAPSGNFKSLGDVFPFFSMRQPYCVCYMGRRQARVPYKIDRITHYKKNDEQSAPALTHTPEFFIKSWAKRGIVGCSTSIFFLSVIVGLIVFSFGDL